MKEKKRITIRLFVLFVLVTGLSGIIATLFVNGHLLRHAQREAREKAMIILERNLAIHRYFSQQLKPKLFETLAAAGLTDSFEPALMSSTYAVREIDELYREIAAGRSYTYKECAINARNPVNEADPFESDFIRQLNENRGLHEFTGVREIGGKPYFVILRRGEVMEPGCLRCHNTPEQAPAHLVETYGTERSYNRSPGEVVSAVSLRIPLEAAYAEVRGHTLGLSALLAVMLFMSLGIIALWGKRWIFDPLSRIKSKAAEIAGDTSHLGDQIDEPEGRELAELTRTFNSMSDQLRREHDLLEERVAKRTEQLSRVNRQLRREIKERQEVIARLNASLQEIKTLQGILPICSYCKNVRDDKGSWKRLEAYIEEHSDAAFSHGICQECARKHFPDIDIDSD